MGKTKKIVLAVLGTLLLLLLGLAVKFVYDINHVETVFSDDFDMAHAIEIQATPQSTPVPADTLTLEATPSPTPDEAALLAAQSDAEFMKKRVNILLLGLDRSTERAAWNSFRTDTMVLVSVNFDDKAVSMISIPRDSYVKIHNKKSRDKINTAFGTGGGVDKNGYEYAMKTVSALFGDVPVNYYVGFDMNVVKDVVNAMGGVNYEVDVPIKMNGRAIEVGYQHLDGQQVLDYCRQRKGSSDIARVDRQQRMLMAIFDQLKTTGQIGNIPQIYQAVEQNLDTNLSLKQICSLALFAKDLTTAGITRYTVEGEFLNMNGISYWGVSNTKLKKLVKEVFAKSFSPDASGDVYAIKKELTALSTQINSAKEKAWSRIQKGEALLAGSGLTTNEQAAVSNAVNALRGAYESENLEQLLLAIDQYDSAAAGLSADPAPDTLLADALPEEGVSQDTEVEDPAKWIEEIPTEGE